MGSGRKKIYVPFDILGYINGAHPLVDGFTQIVNPNFEFTRFKTFANREWKAVSSEVKSFSDQLGVICLKESLDHSTAWRVVNDFILTRRPEIEMSIPLDADFVFHHTVPYSLNCKNYILHVESISQLFFPYLLQGTPPVGSLKRNVAYHFLKHMLEAPSCLQVFTNMQFTVDQFRNVFQSKIIDQKVRLCKPSGRLEADTISEILKKRRGREKKELNILFTNSYHDDPLSFYLRGGFDILLCVLQISQHQNNVNLTIRSSVPPEIRNSALWDAIVACKHIRWIDSHITETELIDLYSLSDVFYLHSNALHSLSILRGMSMGLTCIVSDVLGVSEYIQHNFNGIQLNGRKNAVNREDHATGWIYDDYREVLSQRLSPSVNFEEQKTLIMQLAEGKDMLDFISKNAIKTAADCFSEEASNASFIKMIDEIT